MNNKKTFENKTLAYNTPQFNNKFVYKSSNKKVQKCNLNALM